MLRRIFFRGDIVKVRYNITVENKRLKYQFEIKRNITVVRGDSATGKTTLIEMLQNFQRAGENSGITITSGCPLVVASEDDWQYRIEKNPGSIIFVDEGNHFVVTEEFASAVQKSDNYFVLVLRDNLPNLPYSCEEIYGIRTSEKYAGLKKIYHEFYSLYGDLNSLEGADEKLVITQDSNSGYEFFCELYKSGNTDVISAEGKSNIIKLIKKNKERNLLVIADGAAFGPEMEAVIRLVKNGISALLYLPESFEWVILKSGCIENSEISDILNCPENYIDSQEYFSWERYFTNLLISETQDTYLKYNKKKINEIYLSGKIFEKICNVLPDKIK